MLLLKLLCRASVSTWACTPSQPSALPPSRQDQPTNQSTFLINCIQIGRHLLEPASEKTCFPARLSSAGCYFCLGTKAHYPHTTCALSKEETPTTRSQTFPLCPCVHTLRKTHTFQLRGAIWCARRVNWTLLRNVRRKVDDDYWKADNSCCGSAQRRLLVVGGLGRERDVFLHRREPQRRYAHVRIFFASSNQSTFLTQPARRALSLIIN